MHFRYGVTRGYDGACAWQADPSVPLSPAALPRLVPQSPSRPRRPPQADAHCFFFFFFFFPLFFLLLRIPHDNKEGTALGRDNKEGTALGRDNEEGTALGRDNEEGTALG